MKKLNALVVTILSLNNLLTPTICKAVTLICFSIILGYVNSHSQTSQPTSFKGSILKYKTITTSLGELTVPEKTYISIDNGTCVKLQVELIKNYAYGLDINKYYITPGKSLDNATAKQTASGLGTFNVLREDCKQEGECFFELESSTKIKYYSRSTKGSAKSDFYFVIMASSAMNMLGGKNTATPLKMYAQVLKGTSAQDSMDPELQALMEYSLFTFKPAGKDVNVEAYKKENEALKTQAANLSTQQRGIESMSTVSTEVKNWLTQVKTLYPLSKQLSLQDSHLWSDITNDLLASSDKQDVFIMDFTNFFINKYGKVKGNHIEIIEYVYSKNENGYELGDRPFAIRIPIEWYNKNAEKIKKGETSAWVKLLGRLEVDEYVPSAIKGTMYSAPVINVFEIADDKAVWKNNMQ
jgi:hypothetical protein